jgi:hypothetical protein
MSAEITSEQLSNLIGLVQSEARKAVETQLSSANVSYEEAHKLIASSTVFQKHFKNATFAAFRELYLKPKHASNEYLGPEAVDHQLERIRFLFPEIGGANSAFLSKLKSGEISYDPQGFLEKDRGFWCIPRWESIASTYSEAVRTIFTLLKESFGGKFSASASSQIDEHCLKESKYKREMMQKLFEQQGSDVLIMEAQFGDRYAGMIAKQVRARMASNEFCLGIYEVAIMLLLAKNRFSLQHNNLGIDASGDLWRYPGSEKFVCTPFFSQRAILGVEFGCHRMLDKKYYGAASALVPNI